MDLFAMMGIEVEEVNKVEAQKHQQAKEKRASLRQQSKNKAKAKSGAEKAKADKIKHLKDNLKPLKLSEEWNIHYARATFKVHDVLARLVDRDPEVDQEELKLLLWPMLPDEVKEHITYARQQPQDVTSEKKNEAGPEDAADDLELDEEAGELVKKAKSSVNEKSKTPQPAYTDGDYTLALLEQALALDFYEFATPGAISWRVDDERKALMPFISNGKLSAYRKLYPCVHAYEKEDEQVAISIVAAEDGYYDIRENPLVRISNKIDVLPELGKVEAGVTIKKRIPSSFFKQSYLFFRHWAEQKLEAVVYIVYSHAKQEYLLKCPKQRVFMTDVLFEYEDCWDEEVVCVIHSHHMFPAHFSTNDDKHDVRAGVYIIVGANLTQVNIRAGFNGHFHQLSFDDVFYSDGMENQITRFPEQWLENVTRG